MDENEMVLLSAYIEGETLYIMDVWIPEELRGKGMGTKMVMRVIEMAKEKGCKEVCMDVASDTMERIAKKLGFEPTGCDSDVGKHYRLVIR